VSAQETSYAFLRSHASVNTSSHVPKFSSNASSDAVEVFSSFSDVHPGVSLSFANMASSKHDEGLDHVFHHLRERFPSFKVLGNTFMSAAGVMVSVLAGVVASVFASVFVMMAGSSMVLASSSVVVASMSFVHVRSSVVVASMSFVHVRSSVVVAGMSFVHVRSSVVVTGNSMVLASSSDVNVGRSAVSAGMEVMAAALFHVVHHGVTVLSSVMTMLLSMVMMFLCVMNVVLECLMVSHGAMEMLKGSFLGTIFEGFASFL